MIHAVVLGLKEGRLFLVDIPAIMQGILFTIFLY